MNDTFDDSYRIEERKIRVSVSPKCNLHCSYCDQGKDRNEIKTGAMEDFRSTCLEKGVINTCEYIKIIKALGSVGYSGITLTGGEPMLNHEWDNIVKGAKNSGFKRVCMTTNGSLLLPYLEKNKSMPSELDTLTISLDTFDDSSFRDITGCGLGNILEGVRLTKELSPNLIVKANKVVMRSGLDKLREYVEICNNSGIIDQITLLNLICKNPTSSNDKTFFNNEFVGSEEILRSLNGYSFNMNDKYEYFAKLKSGLEISIVDTNETLRSDKCDDCPIYCQEGLYTTRVASDGTIRTCIDYNNLLPYKKYNSNETSIDDIRTLLGATGKTRLEKTFGKFCTKYGLLGNSVD